MCQNYVCLEVKAWSQRIPLLFIIFGCVEPRITYSRRSRHLDTMVFDYMLFELVGELTLVSLLSDLSIP